MVGEPVGQKCESTHEGYREGEHSENERDAVSVTAPLQALSVSERAKIAAPVIAVFLMRGFLSS